MPYKNIISWCLVLLLISAFELMAGNVRAGWFDNQALRIWVFDIGQGDAIYIDGPERDALVDGGPDDKVLAKLAAVMLPWDRFIDLVVNTHPHADHIDGLVSVLERYDVDEVWHSGAVHHVGDVEAFLDASKNIRTPMAGERFDLGDGAWIQVISVPEAHENYFDDLNEASIIVLVGRGEQPCMLLTGDAGIDEERLILADLPQVPVLKVGHHGSSTSTSNELIEAIQPHDAIISLGTDNSFGHPNAFVVDRLERAGTHVWRTDLDHDVKVDCDNRGAVTSIRL